MYPRSATFNAVLLAYSNAGDCEGAFRILSTLEDYVKDECPNAQPDTVSFNTLISACAKAGKPQVRRADLSSQLTPAPSEACPHPRLLACPARARQPAPAERS